MRLLGFVCLRTMSVDYEKMTSFLNSFELFLLFELVVMFTTVHKLHARIYLFIFFQGLYIVNDSDRANTQTQYIVKYKMYARAENNLFIYMFRSDSMKTPKTYYYYYYCFTTLMRRVFIFCFAQDDRIIRYCFKRDNGHAYIYYVL